jgi:hypothetical protein
VISEFCFQIGYGRIIVKEAVYRLAERRSFDASTSSSIIDLDNSWITGFEDRVKLYISSRTIIPHS